ncbi:MAG: hypothetical protein J5552_01865 [Prevotella sp.]|nr:hypothetical protein [Prevotella sp.]
MTTIQNNKKEINEGGTQEHSRPPSNIHLDLQKLSPKHRKEYFEVKPILDSLGIELTQDGISDKPDFRFTYDGKEIGLETTRCYPPDALIHKNNKDQNKYEIGDKGVEAIIKKYKKYKTERREWVSLLIWFEDGLYYTLRDTSLAKKEIEEIDNEVIEEIENHIEDYLYCKTIDKKKTELHKKHYKYVSDISWDEPQEGIVIIGGGRHAMPARTIELEPFINAISDKESKLAEYRQLEHNKEIDEYWLCVNLPLSSRRFFNDLEPFEMQSGYTRIYVTQFVDARRIK